MDLVSKRYSSPFSLLDEMIQNSELNTFIPFLLNKNKEEENDKQLWEFFLAKVYNKTFKEWKDEVKSESEKNDAMNEATKEEIIQKSTSILKGFNPQNKGGER